MRNKELEDMLLIFGGKGSHHACLVRDTMVQQLIL